MSCRWRPDSVATFVWQYQCAELTVVRKSSAVPQSARRAPCKFVPEGRDLEVVDAETDEDRTRSVLAQIIMESGSRNANLLPDGVATIKRPPPLAK